LLIVINFQPIYYEDFRIGVPDEGAYEEIFNSDALCFGGSGVVNHKPIKTIPYPWHGKDQSICIKLPPLGGVLLRS
jgi:1,4-alpha-glucan branching enzyme